MRHIKDHQTFFGVWLEHSWRTEKSWSSSRCSRRSPWLSMLRVFWTVDKLIYPVCISMWSSTRQPVSNLFSRQLFQSFTTLLLALVRSDSRKVVFLSSVSGNVTNLPPGCSGRATFSADFGQWSFPPRYRWKSRNDTGPGNVLFGDGKKGSANVTTT